MDLRLTALLMLLLELLVGMAAVNTPSHASGLSSGVATAEDDGTSPPPRP